MNPATEHPLPEVWRILIPVVLGGLAIMWMLPRGGRRSRLWGVVFGVVAIAATLFTFRPFPDDAVRDGLFYVFAFGAIGSGAMMITDRNPVYSALWFALVTLSTCGLFLLNSAPFLSAATVIVYAGAIIVTFLFVIMLAQQAGATAYDQQSAQPTLASVAAFLLLASLLYTLDAWGGSARQNPDQVARAQFLHPPAGDEGNPLSQPLLSTTDPPQTNLGSLSGVGRSLFGDYLFAVELAGTVLLIASIGAIAIAPRRSQGHL